MSTITDPEVIKKVQAANAKRKADYEDSRGKKPGREVMVTVCNVCRSRFGTFQWVLKRFDDGRIGKVMVHVNCPGPVKK